MKEIAYMERMVREGKSIFREAGPRKALCETCLKLAVVVLVCSAFIGFNP